MTDPDPASSHRRFEDMALAHVLGGLNEARSRMFRDHLAECERCRARVDELQELASDLAGIEREARSEAARGEAGRGEAARGPSRPRRPAWRPTPEGSAPRGGERAGDAAPDPARLEPPAPSRTRVLAVAAVGLAVVVVLAGALAWLRADRAALERELEQRVAASAALVHGEDVAPSFVADDLEATARRHDDDLALLVEGLEDGEHVLALRSEDQAAPHLERATAADGVAFVVVEPRAGDEQAVLASAGPGEATAGEPLVIVDLDD